jgi:hypothetical protein
VGEDVGSGGQFARGPGEQGIARDPGGATPNDPFRTDNPSERAFTDPQRRQQAIEATARESEQLARDDIIGFRETAGGGYEPLLTAEAKRDQARTATKRASDAVDDEDIQGFRQTSEGAEPVLSGEARLELARKNVELRREARRVFAGTGQVPVGLREGDLEFELQGGEVRATLTDDARQDLSQRRSAAPDQGDGGVFDRERLFNTESTGAKLFGTAEREKAIEQEAAEGSSSGALFVGGEAIEAAGLDATRELDRRIPDFDQSVTVPTVGPGGQVTDLEANPRIGIGTEGTRLTQQLRNVAVGAPAGIGVAGAAAPKAAGDIGLRVEQALGADVDDRATIGAGATGAAATQAGSTVAKGAQEEPVGAAADLFLPAAVSRVSPIRFRRFDVPEQSTESAQVTRSRKAGAAAEAIRQGESPTTVRNVELSPTGNPPGASPVFGWKRRQLHNELRAGLVAEQSPGSKGIVRLLAPRRRVPIRLT